MKTVDGTGIIVPLLTPLNQDEAVNYAHLKKLVDYVVEGGVDGILVMGSTGEFARFDHDVRGRIVEEVVEAVAGRKPVYAGVGDTGLRRVLKNIKQAERAGVDALAVTLPYYYPILHDDEAYRFYSEVAKSASLPIMLYNIPSTCGASLGLKVVEKMLAFDNVIGIKDSSGDKDRLLEEIRLFGGKPRRFTIVVGSEELTYAGFKAGADGVVPSMANPFPRLFAAIYQAARDNDEPALQKFCAIVDELNRINAYRRTWMSPNVWRKKALSHLGICDAYCTEPYLPVDSATDARIQRAVEEYNRMYASPTA